ncbi:MAG: ribonuclease III [Acidimicrobiales bacterium]|nr:ribonuclease III [Acidimicrobiales bacterium]
MVTDAAASLLERLGYVFTDRSLFRLALAHRSWCSEQEEGDEPSNERLEFLGDAVVGLVVAEHAFRQFPDLPEGDLTDVRKSVVNAGALAEVAAELGLGPALLLGKGEDGAGGRTKQSILADAFEALVGALYLDGGLPVARRVVLGLLGPRIDAIAAGAAVHDAKTALQELGVQRHGVGPVYRIAQEGPDHDRRFFATVTLAGEELGRGEGRSKKQAQQAAARMALARLSGGSDPAGDA